MVLRQFVLGVLICCGLAGCEGTYTPGEFTDLDDVKPGPGLFSGEEGEFVIYKGDPLQRNGGAKENNQNNKH